MSEVLPIDEIRQRYYRHWILIGDPESDERDELLSGRVLFASPDRDAVYEFAKALPPTVGELAFDYTGPMPKHFALNI